MRSSHSRLRYGVDLRNIERISLVETGAAEEIGRWGTEFDRRRGGTDRGVHEVELKVGRFAHEQMK